MDLTKFLGQDSQEQSAQRLSKEEYAAQKKQEREEIWGMIDGKAQEVFQNGDSLKGFLDFMGQSKPQRTDNLFLLYAQNPEIRFFPISKVMKSTTKLPLHLTLFYRMQRILWKKLRNNAFRLCLSEY